MSKRSDPIPIPMAWRYKDAGRQLSTGLWWVGYAGPSEINPGRFYYKISGAQAIYCSSQQDAETLLLKDVLAGKDPDGYTYTLVDKVPETLKKIASDLFCGLKKS